MFRDSPQGVLLPKYSWWLSKLILLVPISSSIMRTKFLLSNNIKLLTSTPHRSLPYRGTPTRPRSTTQLGPLPLITSLAATLQHWSCRATLSMVVGPTFMPCPRSSITTCTHSTRRPQPQCNLCLTTPYTGGSSLSGDEFPLHHLFKSHSKFLNI